MKGFAMNIKRLIEIGSLSRLSPIAGIFRVRGSVRDTNARTRKRSRRKGTVAAKKKTATKT